MNERTRHLFPALRCRMGNSVYYATYLTFRDVAEWIKPTDEVHRSKKLSEWIQRQLIRGHSHRIARYLLGNDDRFFNALVIGIYGGRPSWAPLDISAPPGRETLTEAEREYLEASIGLLKLRGSEKLFAIDGQHRVAGIKEALKGSDTVVDDEIIAIFVGHDTSHVGQQKTRRLFVTLNTTARRVSEADRVALDEDDGFAVVTRKMVDDSKLFADSDLIAFAGTASLPMDSDKLTTIINLYQQTRDLYTPRLISNGPKRRHFGSARPPEDTIVEYYETCCTYWTLLAGHVEELQSVIDGKVDARNLRKPAKNHLLMRPVGQRAFAGAVGVLVDRGDEIAKAIGRLAKVNPWLQRKTWHEILWDPIQKRMLKNSAIAESYLLNQIGETARTAVRQKRLEEVLSRRG